jgi:hypothetical protein
MARATAWVPDRVHRPHLSLEQEALQEQYRPPHACTYCAKHGLEPGDWLMEVPRPGPTLEF